MRDNELSRMLLPRLLVRAKRKELFTEMDTMAERRAVQVSESNATGVSCRIRRD